MKIFLTFLIVAVFACSNYMLYENNILTNKSTITELDLNKFMGKWYELARYPHSFEKDLVGVTAAYSLNNNGKINVLNQGYKNTLSGKLKKANGKAKLPDVNQPGKLKVSFFLFFYADYYIYELDSVNYEWALIGSSSDKYLWILSRTPELSPDIFQLIISRVKERGYPVEKLIMVPQISLKE